MKIRTQFITTLLLFGLILFLTTASILITNRQLAEGRTQQKHAENVALWASDLGFLSIDYLIYHEKEQLQRWQTKHESLAAEIARLSAGSTAEQSIITNIRQTQSRLKEVFDNITLYPDRIPGYKNPAFDPAFFQVSWSRLAIQSQSLVSDASRLSVLLRQKTDSLNQSKTTLIYVLAGVFAVFMLTSYLLTYRRVLYSIKKLQAGTKIVGSGNLDYVFDERKNDEIGDLSLAFNNMTASLKNVTASKLLLEKEINERKLAETALRASEAKYRNLFLNITEEVHFWELVRDRGGRIKTWKLVDINPPTFKSWGKTLEEVKGKTTDEIFGPGATEHYLPIVEKIMSEGMPYSYEDYFPNLGKYFRFTSVPLGEEYFITTGADITDSKKAHDILRRDNETLEKLVEKRSQELISTQAELDRAKRLSDIGTLAATVAHELRNPLAAITLAAYNLKKKIDLSAGGKHLDTIEKKVNESEQIITNLLFYSKIKPPCFETINACEALEECLEAAEKQSKKEVRIIRSQASGEQILLEADSIQLKEVFNNILNNALDAVPPTKGEIRISTKSNADAVTITVTDNGPGIDRSFKEKIFDPFFTTKAKGTGLGLSVCRQIITMHKGRIEIESEPGQGTSVSVYLPKKESETAHAPVSAGSVKNPG